MKSASIAWGLRSGIVASGVALALIVVFAITLVVVVFDAGASDLTISNASNHSVTDISITDGKTTWKLGNLNSGAQLRFTQPLQGEAKAVISWKSRGRRHSAEGCYYTGGSPLQGSIIIVSDTVQYRCK